MNSVFIPITASTQEHLEIESITDDIVILKGGSSCLVIETTAVNFGLLSEEEQDATIYAYAGLLNSLSFPIQIVIRSHLKDISSYLFLLNQMEKQQTSPKLKTQTQEYRKFIERTVTENEVLDKKFYIIIPFSLLELGISPSINTGLKTKKKRLPYSIEYIAEKAKTNLIPKKEHLIKQFERLGLKAIALNTQQLIELFYNIYNPEVEGQKTTSVKDYENPIVNAAIEQNNLSKEKKELEAKKDLYKQKISNIPLKTKKGSSLFQKKTPLSKTPNSHHQTNPQTYSNELFGTQKETTPSNQKSTKQTNSPSLNKNQNEKKKVILDLSKTDNSDQKLQEQINSIVQNVKSTNN